MKIENINRKFRQLAVWILRHRLLVMGLFALLIAFSFVGTKRIVITTYMNMYSLVLADTQWCAVNKTYARAFAQQYFLDKQSEWNDNLPFQFYYTVV